MTNDNTPNIVGGTTTVPAQTGYAIYPLRPAGVCPSCGRCRDCGQKDFAPAVPFYQPTWYSWTGTLQTSPNWQESNNIG